MRERVPDVAARCVSQENPGTQPNNEWARPAASTPKRTGCHGRAGHSPKEDEPPCLLRALLACRASRLRLAPLLGFLARHMDAGQSTSIARQSWQDRLLTQIGLGLGVSSSIFSGNSFMVLNRAGAAGHYARTPQRTTLLSSQHTLRLVCRGGARGRRFTRIARLVQAPLSRARDVSSRYRRVNGLGCL